MSPTIWRFDTSTKDPPTRYVFARNNIVDEADLHDGVQKLQEARAASGVRFELFLKGPLDQVFEEWNNDTEIGVEAV